MIEKLARYKKAVVAFVGAVALIAIQLQALPFIDPDSALGRGIAIVAGLGTVVGVAVARNRPNYAGSPAPRTAPRL